MRTINMLELRSKFTVSNSSFLLDCIPYPTKLSHLITPYTKNRCIFPQYRFAIYFYHNKTRNKLTKSNFQTHFVAAHAVLKLVVHYHFYSRPFRKPCTLLLGRCSIYCRKTEIELLKWAKMCQFSTRYLE